MVLDESVAYVRYQWGLALYSVICSLQLWSKKDDLDKITDALAQLGSPHAVGGLGKGKEDLWSSIKDNRIHLLPQHLRYQVLSEKARKETPFPQRLSVHNSGRQMLHN